MPETQQSTPELEWHHADESEIFQQLHTSADGLSDSEAQQRLQSYGPNELEEDKGPSLWKLILKQLRSPLIYILIGASVLSLVMQHYTDAGVILFVIVFNTMLGILQEYRAEKALSALYDLTAPHARVLRDDKEEIDAREVVPGDIVLLEAGDRVPADARLLGSEDLQIDESTLTGESEPANKRAGTVEGDTPLADRHNMIYMSTVVTNGRGRAVVVETGMDSEMGEIAQKVRQTERRETPLQRRLASLAKILGFSGIGLGAVLFGLGLLRGQDVVDMALFSVALAVSAIPEGMPAVVSVTLALGVRRMAKRGSIVRRLAAVETLGSTTVICSDKTGTITRNEMTVKHLWAAHQWAEVTGDGYAPEGDVQNNDGQPFESELPQPLQRLLTTGVLANNAEHEQEEGAWHIEGDPTEGALLVVARKAGVDVESLQNRQRQDEIPFSSEAKYMAALYPAEQNGQAVLHVKGAPERILEFCSHYLNSQGERVEMDDEMRQSITDAAQSMSDDALRTLAAAQKSMDRESVEREDVEQGLTFLGLWGMYDPPREKAIHAIEMAQQAGIRIIMITGDRPDTARAIAQKTGIELPSEETLTGQQLDAMSDEELGNRVRDISIFARVSPNHKIRIVQALQANEEIVAMTGDGVNDAPALKSVNIGIAMGRSGTEVAKEAAEMVLTEDNFATIVNAIEEGRVIYANLRRVAFFLLTTSLAEVLTLGGSLLIGLPLPLTAVMILWINLISDVPADIPLGIEPKHWDVLKQPPRPPQAGLIDWPLLRRMFILCPIVAAGTLGLFVLNLPEGWQSNEMYHYAQTMAFTTLAAFQWFQALLSRSHVLSVFSIGFFRNRWLMLGISTAILLQLLVVYTPFGHTLFNTESLEAGAWLWILLVASSVFIVDELLKLFHVHGRMPKNH